MSRLYELSADLIALQDMLEDSVEDQVLQDTLEAVQGEYEIKIEAYCKVIKNLEADMEALKVEAKRLTDKRKTLENNVNRLKRAMFESMKATNTPKIKGQLFTVAIQRNGGVAPINYDKDNKELTAHLPDQLVNIVETPNLEAIRELLEAGKVVEGFTLGERGESLRIK
jgi:chaperonin cofactor prefoldin